MKTSSSRIVLASLAALVVATVCGIGRYFTVVGTGVEYGVVGILAGYLVAITLVSLAREHSQRMAIIAVGMTVVCVFVAKYLLRYQEFPLQVQESIRAEISAQQYTTSGSSDQQMTLNDIPSVEAIREQFNFVAFMESDMISGDEAFMSRVIYGIALFVAYSNAVASQQQPKTEEDESEQNA